eukprot:TRINITY_DN6682_c0_g1_i11.p2 TRINITY_DN6682_c0_g1~~TRINITY_DN6682_c0_g1_i11.p2  ORF type:complete len:105 (-),score=10.72 TRINITY_DN6682_c0_g1_i11:154-468(-)
MLTVLAKMPFLSLTFYEICLGAISVVKNGNCVVNPPSLIHIQVANQSIGNNCIDNTTVAHFYNLNKRNRKELLVVDRTNKLWCHSQKLHWRELLESTSYVCQCD